ncbi:MAG: hypothetical protein ACPGPS_20305 [Rubripirellula sp.]
MHGGIMLPRALTCYSLLVAICCVSGCSEEQQNAVRQRRDNLAKVGKAYIEMNSQGASPVNADELAKWMLESTDAGTRGEARVSLVEGDVIVNWNGDLNQKYPLGGFVLAFEAGVPARGGYVVMADGIVQSMSLKEFQEAAMLPAN